MVFSPLSEASMKTRVPFLAVAWFVFLWVTATAAPLSARSQAPTPDELRTYETFRAWLTAQPPSVQGATDDAVYGGYSAALRSQGKSAKEVTDTIATLKKLGDRAEVERWNQILTSAKPMFNTAPNAFLVEMIKGVKPGRSLDVGMGQGRNTIYLAQQGWDSVGFDPAERAVAAAQEQARALGVTITTHVARAEDFDWGSAQWDLIVLSYVGGREYVVFCVGGGRGLVDQEAVAEPFDCERRIDRVRPVVCHRRREQVARAGCRLEPARAPAAVDEQTWDRRRPDDGRGVRAHVDDAGPRPKQRRVRAEDAKNIAAGRRVMREDPVDLIYSTSPHATAHLIAMRLAAKGMPWVADFRDPWIEEPPENSGIQGLGIGLT
jgi:SAM-dependent methyltransferase